MNKTAIILTAGLALGACTAPRIESRDQWLAESQRTFKARDVEQALRAAEAVLASVDSATTFVHTPETVESSRRWVFTIIIATVIGHDRITVTAKPAPEGVNVTVRGTREIISGSNREANTLSTVGTYRLFFNWLGYALGHEPKWITCDQAEAELGVKNAGGLDNALCTVSSRGNAPVQPRPEWTKPSAAPRPAPVVSRDLLRPQRASVSRQQ